MANFKSPFQLNQERAAQANSIEQSNAMSRPGPNLTGQEIKCVVGGVNEKPIEVLFHAPSRTVFPVR